MTSPFICALGRQSHADEAAAGLTFDFEALELGLHLLHFRLHGLRLLHQAHHVWHRHVLSIKSTMLKTPQRSSSV